MSTTIFIGREKEINDIIGELSKDAKDPSVKKIISLYGIGGSGKTTILKKVEEKIRDQGLEFGYFRVDEDLKWKSMPEFVQKLSRTFDATISHAIKYFASLDQVFEEYQLIDGKIQAVFSPEEMKTLDKLKEREAKAARRKGKQKLELPSFEVEQLGLKIDSIKFQGQELDGEAEARIWHDLYKERKIQIIEERFKSPDQQKFHQNPMPRITECFFSGLQESIFPKTILGTRRNLNKKPLKVFLIIDTYEKIGDDINDWLLENFYTIYEKSCQDLFDFRLIICGREQLRLSDFLRRWDRFNNTMLEIDVHRFTIDEVRKFLQRAHIASDYAERVYEETEGLAYLVSMWVEFHGAGNAIMYGKAEDRIFWWKTDEQKEWIRTTAFNDTYDQDYLSIMLGAGKAGDAFEWLRNCHEVTRTSRADQDKYEIHSIIRMIIRTATKQRSEAQYQQYMEKIAVYRRVLENFPYQKDRDKLSKLCVFEHFNQIVLEQVYPNEGFTLHNFAKDNPAWFDVLNQSFKMKNEIRKMVTEYSQLLDHDKQNGHREIIIKAWQEKQKNIQDEIEKIKKEIDAIHAQISNLSVQRSENEKRLTLTRSEADGLRARLQNAKSKEPHHQIIKIINWALLIGGVMLMLIAALSTSDKIIRQTIAIAGALLSTGGFARMFLLKHGNTSDFSTSTQSQDSLLNIEQTITELEKERVRLCDQITIHEQNLKSKNQKISSMVMILDEPYIMVESN